MWRRLFSSRLKSLPTLSPSPPQSASAALPFAAVADRSSISRFSPFVIRHFAALSAGAIKKRVEDVMPIATGHEREEIQADLEGKDLLEINYPVGPFGTKEAPAVVKSYFDRRIVGCPGGEGEDEHDVVWFWLEKGKPYECPVCTQYFVLEVVGPGGDPYVHGDDHHH